MKVKITERGWGGHFIGCAHCLFRRNTLIEKGKKKIVVSTVGAYRYREDEPVATIGAGGRYYETMAFKARKENGYWEADVSKQLGFNSEWGIWADDVDKLPDDVDNKANDLHEAVVREFVNKLTNKETP